MSEAATAVRKEGNGLEPGEDAIGLDWALLFGCWLLVAGSSLGSLFFSEVMELAPCSLCWYQRIPMFALTVVLLVGLFPVDRQAVRFGLPLAACGWAIALYHNGLVAGVIPESAAPCRQGVSCSEVDFELFGLFNIPQLSLISFSAVIAGLLVLRWRLSR